MFARTARVRSETGIEGLDVQAAVKAATAIVRLEICNLSSFRRIGGVLAKTASIGGPGDRLYLEGRGRADHPLRVGGTKKRQQADIDRAGALLAEYRKRKAARAGR